MDKELFDLDKEGAVLGTLVSDLPGAFERLWPKLGEDYFYNDNHKAIFRAINALHKERRPVDLLNVKELLDGKVDRDYLLCIEEACVIVCHAEDYIKTLRTLWVKREFRNTYYRLLNSQDGTLVQGLQDFLEKIKDAGDSSKGPQLISAQDILDLQDDLTWTVEGLIPQGGIVMVSGKPGVGKTWMGLVLAKAVSEGLHFLGRSVEISKVVYIDLENPRAVLKKRLEMIRPMAVEFAPGWAIEKSFDLWGKDLDALAKQGYLVILDSLVRAHGKDENSAQEMAQVMNRLRELTHKGATIVFLHHKGKGEDNEYRGSSDILAGVDVAYLLDSKEGHFELRTLKSRVGEDIKVPLSLKINPDGVELKNLTKELETKRLAEEREQLEALAEVLRDLSVSGQYPNQTEIVGACEDKEWDRKTVLKLLAKGERSHWEKIENPSDKRVWLYKCVENLSICPSLYREGQKDKSPVEEVTL